MGFATTIFDSIPEQIDAQVRRADNVISGVKRMINELSDTTVTGKKIKGVVDLAKAINQGGKLSVVHKEGGFEAKFVVFIDSKALGDQLVSVQLTNGNYISSAPDVSG